MPSLASKITLFVSTALTTGIIYLVHKNQVEDRAKVNKVRLIPKKDELLCNAYQCGPKYTKGYTFILVNLYSLLLFAATSGGCQRH